ncbi:hypothetical protein PS870_04518 [Pseudomonas fluorescens]|uniref:Uncharacterized protein n=2 Tax=Pseudomonas fluorescens TaxID=294 RepID=A0A5E7NCP4_PSEFL|nr:hypothetical protein PS870_04518 [Pseudomonas fluorescens]
MSSVFKYSSREFNERLLLLGNTRIGTLYDFRRTEHARGIADPQEGKKEVAHHITEVTDKDKESIHWKAIEAFGFMSFEGGENIKVIGGTFINQFDEPDCYMHCSSADYTYDAMSQLENADSCVEVFDALGFYRRITETLNMLVGVNFEGVFKVKYMKRNSLWNGSDWGEHPALIKEPEYKRQVEIRAIWTPKNSKPISPVFLNDVGLIKFCRRIATPKPDAVKRK